MTDEPTNLHETQIAPTPKRDPLFEVLGDLEWYNNSAQCAAELRAACEARGLKIVEASHDGR